MGATRFQKNIVKVLHLSREKCVVFCAVLFSKLNVWFFYTWQQIKVQKELNTFVFLALVIRYLLLQDVKFDI